MKQMNLSLLAPTAALLALSSGCAAEPAPVVERWTEPRPLGRELSPYRPTRDGTSEAAQPLADEETIHAITLGQALGLALARNPDLAAFSWDVRIGEARILQAGLRPNPTVTLEPQDFLGTGAYRGFKGPETTLQLSQLIELGGKRSARMKAAALDRDLAAWDYEAKRIAVFSQTAQDFLEVLREQQRLALADESVRLARQVVETVSARVKAAATHAEEATKAEVALASGQIERDQIQRALVAARLRLAANWGSTRPHFERVEGSLESITPLPAWEQVAQKLAQNPELARWVTAISQREAALELERAKAKPDVTVGGGIRRKEETSDNALVVGLSIPLPLFNRNQGNIKEAEHRLARSREERRAAEVHATTALQQAYQALAAAEAEINALRQKVLPGAERVFEAVSEHYREARYSYLEVLDAQRTLFAARSQLLRSLTDYHRAVLAIERLIGEPLPTATARP
jgi:cobalt-zinc-cadmium efflux system outer membrane protein